MMRNLQAVTFLMRSRPFRMLAKNTSDKKARRVARKVAAMQDVSSWLFEGFGFRGNLLMMDGFVSDWPRLIQYAAYMQGQGLTYNLSDDLQLRCVGERFKSYKRAPTIQCMDQLYEPAKSV